MVDTLEELKKQHLDNYKLAIIEIIHNNTDVLVNEDIMSLIRKPPLDSMDVIKSKFLDLAKKNKVVLNTFKLDELLNGYRSELTKCCDEIRKIRIETLEQVIADFSLSKDTDVIKINKKELNEINRKLKKIIKDYLQVSIESRIIRNFDSVFSNEVASVVKKKICDELVKFVKGAYQRQLLESVDFKTLVKDTTLANSVKEYGERYLFTLANSRIFKQDDN